MTTRFVKLVFPRIEDLSTRRSQIGPRVGEYPVGTWGSETRDYRLSFDVGPGLIGTELLVARVSVISHGEPQADALIRATWTDDTPLAVSVDPHLAHYTGQTELARAIQEGIDIIPREGDEEAATAALGRALRLANESRNTAVANLLARVVDVVDPAAGTRPTRCPPICSVVPN